jgi:3-mercaptopyruvate sulfurtransferase SseA
MMRLGLANVYALEGGWQAWLDQQLPVQTGATVPAGPQTAAGRA